MQKMQSNDLLKSNENNEDNAKVTANMNATIIIPSQFVTKLRGTNLTNTKLQNFCRFDFSVRKLVFIRRRSENGYVRFIK
jgi:hypothetical protein